LDDSNDKQQSSVLLRAVPASAATLLRSTMSRTKLVSPYHKKSTGNSFSITDFEQHQQQQSNSEAQAKLDAEMLQALRDLNCKSFLTISPEPQNYNIPNSEESGNENSDQTLNNTIKSLPPLPFRESKLHQSQQ
jgi:hypothetical protein